MTREDPLILTNHFIQEFFKDYKAERGNKQLG